MAFSSWRGIVGMINPTMRPGATEEVIRLLPLGIGLIPLFLDFRRGTTDEFKAAMPAYERNVALLAEQGCDLINPVGAPPFMVMDAKPNPGWSPPGRRNTSRRSSRSRRTTSPRSKR